MRKLFWIILLTNVILFALIQKGWVWREGPALHAQPGFNEEKVILLDDELSLPQVPSRAPLPNRPVILPSPATDFPVPDAISSSLATNTNDQLCLEWGDFSGAELKLASAVLSSMQLGNKLDKRQVDQVIRYWVYIPPLKNKTAVQQKIAQLKARGIEEYFIVPDNDPWRGAISLGVFKTQEAANNFHKVLRGKDVRSARVGARAGKQKATIFILKGISHTTEARINSLKKDFPGSELKNVPCTH